MDLPNHSKGNLLVYNIKLTTLACANLDKDCTLDPAVIQAVLCASGILHHCWYSFQLLSAFDVDPSRTDEHFHKRNAHTCALLSF